MRSLREMRLRIRSVKNIAQVTKALEAVSASKVRRAQQAAVSARPYASKAWQVLRDLASQPGGENLHPLLVNRSRINQVLVVMISGDRGLAGAYYVNIVRETLRLFRASPVPVRYIVVGRKGREMLIRRGADLVAEFSHLPTVPGFADVSAIGRMAVNEFLNRRVDEVYLAYTEFVSFIHQRPRVRRLLPLHIPEAERRLPSEAAPSGLQPIYLYEPGQAALLDQIIPRFTMLQVYQAILESLASEHAARMVTMSHATENALELVGNLQLDYNKARQESITSDLLDISGGAEALSASVQAVAPRKGT
jgi:F-type H+-transporting ATPase subunit gamma